MTDPAYLGLEEGVYPVILQTLGKLFRGEYEEAVLCWGIGSGKSYLCSLALLYMLYRTLCLVNPQKYYELGEGSQIAIVNVGPTARVAEKVIFGEVRELVRRSPWFVEKYPADARMRKELHFAKNVAVIPGNSSELFPLGLNVLAATMDEASFFVETLDGGREAADEVYLALQRRVKSRFGEKGLMLIASSPRHEDDFVMRKLVEAESNATIFASRKATWEVKPKSRFCGEVFEYKDLTIPVEFQRDFKRNGQKAMRDLAAMPGAAYAPFFVEMGALEEAWGGERPALKYRSGGERPSGTRGSEAPTAAAMGEKRADGLEACAGGTVAPQGDRMRRKADGTRALRSEGLRREAGRMPALQGFGEGPELRHPFDAEGRLEGWFRAGDRHSRYVHVDLGLKKDACGIAMAKVEGVEGMPTVVVELMAQVKAPPGGEVDFAQVRELILAIRGRGFPIAQVSYDGWQSVDSLQILRRKGMKAETVSVGLNAYETLKEVANDRRLRMYEFRPFVEECRRLEMIRGKNVDHPPGGSKDVADAVAGAVSEALKDWRGDEEVRGRIV